MSGELQFRPGPCAKPRLKAAYFRLQNGGNPLFLAPLYSYIPNKIISLTDSGPLHGVQGVECSNHSVPTIKLQEIQVLTSTWIFLCAKVFGRIHFRAHEGHIILDRALAELCVPRHYPIIAIGRPNVGASSGATREGSSPASRLPLTRRKANAKRWGDGELCPLSVRPGRSLQFVARQVDLPLPNRTPTPR